MGPPFAQGESALRLGLNRNKENLALGYTQPAGREHMRALVQIAEVLIVDLLPIERQRYHLAYTDLAPLNPRLIYGAVAGWGDGGPWAKLANTNPYVQVTVVSGLPWRFSHTPCQRQAPSDPGQYTQAVLRSTGRNPAEIAGAIEDRPKFVDAAALSSQPF